MATFCQYMFIFVLNQHKMSSCIRLMIFTIFSKSRWITLGHSFHRPLPTVINITQTFLKMLSCLSLYNGLCSSHIPAPIWVLPKHMARSNGTTENNLIKFPLKRKGKTAGNGKRAHLPHHWLWSAGETEETSQKVRKDATETDFWPSLFSLYLISFGQSQREAREQGHKLGLRFWYWAQDDVDLGEKWLERSK